MASTSVAEPERRRGMVMRLHLVRGSFFSADGGAGGGYPIMDAEVWSRLPEEILWEVLLLLPATKHFELQLVSRKWRQVLTSAHFRNRITAAAAAPRESEQQQSCVVACVSDGRALAGSSDSSGGGAGDSSSSKKLKVEVFSSSRKKQVKVVDVDLSGFVPDWFWASPGTYSVVAAGDGLVCISNDSEAQHSEEQWEAWKPWTNRYCLLNPLTRTCVVLPKLPFRPSVVGGWLPPTRDALTVCGHRQVATYNLNLLSATGGAAPAASASGWVTAAHNLEPAVPRRVPGEPPYMALCGGQTFKYYQEHVHVLAPDGPGGGRLQLVRAAAPVRQPSVSLLGLDPAAAAYLDEELFLVAHRGALFFVAWLLRPQPPWDPAPWCGVPLGVWRLAGDRTQWEPVACLHVRDLERLTGLSDVQYLDVYIGGAYGARELVCCYVQVRTAWRRVLVQTTRSPPPTFLLGFNLDTREWELVHHDRAANYPKPDSASLAAALPLELRPHLFLSQTANAATTPQV